MPKTNRRGKALTQIHIVDLSASFKNLIKLCSQNISHETVDQYFV